MSFYPRALRSVVLPVLDRFNRTDIARKVRHLEDSQWYPLERLRAEQELKLERLFEWVERDTSFYPRFWREADAGRRAASVYSKLDGLPVVSKSDLRNTHAEFPEPAYRGRVLRVNSSGSTGAPTTFFRSAEQESWFWALRFRMWAWAGYTFGDPYLAINLNPRTAWKKRIQDLLFRCSYLTYNADNQNSAQILATLESRKILHINGFSSTLLVLAKHMIAHGVSNPGVRVITTTGDNLLPEQRQLIADAFGVRPIDYYGAGGEGVHLASQCLESDGYHVHMENAIVEILRDGRPARPGELGSIVVTQLDNYAMPLIRYELGDLAIPSDCRNCPCGRAFPLIESIHGRSSDIVWTPNGTAILPQFFFIGEFKTLENVHRYQILQRELSRITIKLVPEQGCNRPACERSLASAIERASEGSLEVDFEWLDQIPLVGLGKPCTVVSELEPLSATARS